MTEPSVQGQYVVNATIELDPAMRELLEHLRRQAIEDVRRYDVLLYGRSDKTIPKRNR